MEVLLKTIPNSDKIIQEYKNDIALCKKAGEKEFDCIKLVDLKYTRKYPALKDLVYPWVNYDWDYTTFVDNNYNNKVTGATDRATLGGLFDNMDAMTTLGKGYIFNANPGSNSQAGTSDLTQCDPTSNDYAGCTILNEIRQSGKGQAPPYPDSFFNKSLSGENSSSYYIKAGTCPKPELNHKECLSKGYQWIGNPLFDATPASLRPSDFIPGSCFKPKYAYIKNTPGLELDFGDIANINKDLGDLASKAAGGLSKLASVGMDSDNGNGNTPTQSTAQASIQGGVAMSNTGLEMAQGPINAMLSQFKGAAPSLMGDALSINPLALLSIANGHSTNDFEAMKCEGFTTCPHIMTPSAKERWWTTTLFALLLFIISFVLVSFIKK